MKTEYPLYIFGSVELGLLKLIKDGYQGKVKLIYFDPPYFSNSDFYRTAKEENEIEKAKSDFNSIFEISKNLLSEDGLLIFHSNFRYSANYLNQLISVFGNDNLINEIIWNYKKASNRISKLVNCHDNLYVFSKSKSFKINTKLVESKSPSLSDVWTDIEMTKYIEKEILGYPFAKPPLLFLRLLNLFSEENDIVIDAITGSGSFLVTASTSKRNAIGIDHSLDSFIVVTKRFEQIGINLKHVKVEDVQLGKSQKEIASEEKNLLEEDKNNFKVLSNPILTSSEKIKEDLEKLPIERINKALELPIDLIKKISFLVACAFPAYIVINLISNNIYWLLITATISTLIWLLFFRISLNKTSDNVLFNMKTSITIIFINILLLLAVNQIIQHKELIKSIKELIK